LLEEKERASAPLDLDETRSTLPNKAAAKVWLMGSIIFLVMFVDKIEFAGPLLADKNFAY